jgi:hypothetical protein
LKGSNIYFLNIKKKKDGINVIKPEFYFQKKQNSNWVYSKKRQNMKIFIYINFIIQKLLLKEA